MTGPIATPLGDPPGTLAHPILGWRHAEFPSSAGIVQAITNSQLPTFVTTGEASMDLPPKVGVVGRRCPPVWRRSSRKNADGGITSIDRHHVGVNPIEARITLAEP